MVVPIDTKIIKSQNSHRIASHRIASHRIASHRIASLSLATTLPEKISRAALVLNPTTIFFSVNCPATWAFYIYWHSFAMSN